MHKFCACFFTPHPMYQLVLPNFFHTSPRPPLNFMSIPPKNKIKCFDLNIHICSARMCRLAPFLKMIYRGGHSSQSRGLNFFGDS